MYGYQWTKFNDELNQVDRVIEELKVNPYSRRLLVTAYNPLQANDGVLYPCHYNWQLVSNGEYLDLIWLQRSVDTVLGLPFNIANYATLLTMIAKMCNLTPRYLVGQLGDVHIYLNQMEGVEKQLKRTPKELPQLIIPKKDSIYDYVLDDFELINYNPDPFIKFAVAV